MSSYYSSDAAGLQLTLSDDENKEKHLVIQYYNAMTKGHRATVQQRPCTRGVTFLKACSGQISSLSCSDSESFERFESLNLP